MKFRYLASLFAAAGASVVLAQDDVVDAEAELRRVQDRIEALDADVQRQLDRRGAAERALRNAEVAEGDARVELRRIRTELAAARTRLSELSARAEATRADLATHIAQLEHQVRLAYVTGREEWLRLVLSQQDPIVIGRQLVYYGYITRQRGEVMTAVREQLRKLETTMAAVDRQRQTLQQLEESQADRLAELSAAREDRRVALARIDERIASQQGELERLQAQAADLESLVMELTRLLAGLPMGDATPFGEMMGQLDWPADGTVARSFGHSRADGRMRWEGVLVAANAGSDVRAVHHGRVVFADWLPGMGLLIVLEHGDGYLSLYGHNQELLKDIGEWVSPGDVIAHVGDSGGQAAPGLYFEIRKDGQPVNPSRWLSR